MDNNANRTLWVGGLSDQVTEEILYELFLQVGSKNNKIDTAYFCFTNGISI